MELVLDDGTTKVVLRVIGTKRLTIDFPFEFDSVTQDVTLTTEVTNHLAIESSLRSAKAFLKKGVDKRFLLYVDLDTSTSPFVNLLMLGKKLMTLEFVPYSFIEGFPFWLELRGESETYEDMGRENVSEHEFFRVGVTKEQQKELFTLFETLLGFGKLD